MKRIIHILLWTTSVSLHSNQQAFLVCSYSLSSRHSLHHSVVRKPAALSTQARPLLASRGSIQEEPTASARASNKNGGGGSSVLGRRIRSLAAASFCVAMLALSSGPAAFADDYGVEVEAPTLFTGETVDICVKRGPLGACVQTVKRTLENDNDKAQKYFRNPSDAVKRKEEAMVKSATEDSDNNSLIEKLRQQSQDNAEKNRLYVERKTFDNDQSATFGPFSRQVVIMNTDGKTFTLLENPQAMRLKKAGFINKNREFIKQPTEEELEAALEGDSSDEEGGGLAGALVGIFGGGD